MSDTVDWEYYADRTEGFSGADLQALVYNAHLDVIHTSIENTVASSSSKQSDSESSPSFEHTKIQASEKMTVMSQAEESKLVNRVNFKPYAFVAYGINLSMLFAATTDD
jgi:peroxin-1